MESLRFFSLQPFKSFSLQLFKQMFCAGLHAIFPAAQRLARKYIKIFQPTARDEQYIIYNMSFDSYIFEQSFNITRKYDYISAEQRFT